MKQFLVLMCVLTLSACDSSSTPINDENMIVDPVVSNPIDDNGFEAPIDSGSNENSDNGSEAPSDGNENPGNESEAPSDGNENPGNESEEPSNGNENPDNGNESEEPKDGSITGASCKSTGSKKISKTVVVGAGETYDGKCQTFNPTFGDGSQSESQPPVFRVNDGGTLRNVIIGDNGADGVHTYGDVKIDNVTWKDVGEDALTIKGKGTVYVSNIEGYDASDKFFQINAESTLRVENCIIKNAGKALRQNGGKTFPIDVAFNRCKIINMKEGIFRTDSPNSVARISNSELQNSGKTCIGKWKSCGESDNSDPVSVVIPDPVVIVDPVDETPDPVVIVDPIDETPDPVVIVDPIDETPDPVVDPVVTPTPTPTPSGTTANGFGGKTTGGQGGSVVVASTGTQINEAICNRASNDSPIVIYIDGTINHGNTSKRSGTCDTKDDAIELKRVSNISLIGVGNRGVLDQIGIHLRESSNIIIQNLHIKNVKKSGSPTSNGGDAIGMEAGVQYVWVDHNTLEASGGESSGYDSLIDMKNNTKNVTVSYNHLRNSSRGGLIGSSDSDDKNTDITFHHNWYENIEQRTPLVRHGKVHTYNNYWTNKNNTDMYHGINSRMGAKVLVEGNYFFRTNNPLLASTDSSKPGCWETNGDNTLDEVNYSRSEGNGALSVPDITNGQLQSTCSVSVPYSYSLDRSGDVPSIVRANAGFGVID